MRQPGHTEADTPEQACRSPTPAGGTRGRSPRECRVRAARGEECAPGSCRETTNALNTRTFSKSVEVVLENYPRVARRSLQRGPGSEQSPVS